MIISNFLHHQTFLEYEALFQQHPHRVITYPAYTSLPLREKTTGERILYYVKKGMLSLYVDHDSGREKLLGFWGVGCIYPLTLSDQDPSLDEYAHLIARRSVEVWAFRPSELEELFSMHPELWKLFLSYYYALTEELFFYQSVYALENVHTRICTLLYTVLYNMNFPNTSRQITVTQSELASLAGATREATVKELRKLRDLGIIETARSGIRISDPAALYRLSSSYLIDFPQQ